MYICECVCACGSGVDDCVTCTVLEGGVMTMFITNEDEIVKCVSSDLIRLI